MYRVLFLGQKPVGEAAFEQLAAAEGSALRLCAVCTNATEEVWWNSAAIWRRAQQLDIPRLANDKRREDELLALIKEQNINLLLSVQHNWVLSEELLAAVGHNALNLHLAKLPDYKGYYAFNHAILNGDTSYAVTLHWMTKAVDDGAIAWQPSFPITGEDTAFSLYEKSVAAGLGAFGEMLAALGAGRPLPRLPMAPGGKFYGRNSLEEQRRIRDINDAEEVNRKARAFYYPPFDGAYFMQDGHKYLVSPG